MAALMNKAEKDFISDLQSFLKNKNVDVIDKTEYEAKIKTLFDTTFKMTEFKYKSELNKTIYRHQVDEENIYYEPNLGLLIVKQVFTNRGFDE